MVFRRTIVNLLKKQLGVEAQFPELPGSPGVFPFTLERRINSDSPGKKVLSLLSYVHTQSTSAACLSLLYSSKEGSSLEERPHVALRSLRLGSGTRWTNKAVSITEGEAARPFFPGT